MVKNVKPEEIKNWIKVICKIHTDTTGYRNDLRSVGTMEQTVFEVLRQEDKYNTKEKMAAYLLYEIAIKHPFWDGNKRTALMTALYIMKLKTDEFFPKDWSDTENLIVRFMLDVAIEKYSYDEVLEIIKEMFKYIGDKV